MEKNDRKYVATIKFWSTVGYWGCFSNFSRHPITVNGKLYPTTEHFYQAMKMADPVDGEKVRLCKTPKEAKTIAKTMAMKESWEMIKYDVMKEALRYKAQQHPEFKSKLLETNGALIQEASPFDSIWGIGKDGKGQNLLGKCLMEIRDEIIAKNTN